MIHKILDKIDRIVAQKRRNGELDAWVSSGSAKKYCKNMATKQKHYYPALVLYLERHIQQH